MLWNEFGKVDGLPNSNKKYKYIKWTNESKTTKNIELQINKRSGYFLIKSFIRIRGGKMYSCCKYLVVHTSVFNTIEHNNLFKICTPWYWHDPDTFKKLEEWIQQGKSNQIKLHVNGVNKRGSEIKVGANTN